MPAWAPRSTRRNAPYFSRRAAAVDYRARRDKGEALAPETWIRQHMSAYYDAVALRLHTDGKKRLAELRKTTKL